MPGLPRARQFGCTNRFDCYDARRRTAQLDGCGNTRRQSAATNGHNDCSHIGKVAGDLQPQRPLARNDPLVVVRRYHNGTGFGGKLLALLIEKKWGGTIEVELSDGSRFVCTVPLP